LHRYLKAQQGGRLPEAQAAFYVRQLLEALHYLHGQGIMHRDLKPEVITTDWPSTAKLYWLTQVSLRH